MAEGWSHPAEPDAALPERGNSRIVLSVTRCSSTRLKAQANAPSTARLQGEVTHRARREAGRADRRLPVRKALGGRLLRLLCLRAHWGNREDEPLSRAWPTIRAPGARHHDLPDYLTAHGVEQTQQSDRTRSSSPALKRGIVLDEIMNCSSSATVSPRNRLP